ncbi:MAG: hypothetical protein K2H56_00650 [Malacoplasma sp.]|nr:hypothetical protein [Malacoplasma sp.]MDE7099766.1 hypothetical protein [Malacoplasma sp.]
MKIKKKFVFLSSAFLAITAIGAPIILTSCGNTASQNNSDYNDSDEKDGKVKDIVNNPEINGNLKYKLTDLSQESNKKQALYFTSIYKDESGQWGSKTIEELEKEIDSDRSDWTKSNSEDQSRTYETYTLNNYNNVNGFTWLVSLTTFYADDSEEYALDKQDVNYDGILSNSLNKEAQIIKIITKQDENVSTELLVVISISLKSEFVWKSNDLNYDISFGLYLNEKEEVTQ